MSRRHPGSRRATRCATTGKASYPTRKAARTTASTSSVTGPVNVYACVACLGWHIGHTPAHVLSGEKPRFTAADQVALLGVEASVVRRCPACGAEGTLRVGILHAASCDWRGGDERLPLRS